MGFLAREFKVFVILLVLLSLLMHFGAWLSHPVSHFTSLAQSSLGLWHPLFLTFILYSIVGVIRWIVSFFRSKRKS